MTVKLIQVFLYLTVASYLVLCHPIHDRGRRGDNCKCNDAVNRIINCCNDAVLNDINQFTMIFENFNAQIKEQHIVRQIMVIML